MDSGVWVKDWGNPIGQDTFVGRRLLCRDVDLNGTFSSGRGVPSPRDVFITTTYSREKKKSSTRLYRFPLPISSEATSGEARTDKLCGRWGGTNGG